MYSKETTMKNLRIYFSNPFDTKEVSDSELQSFAQDHVERLRAANIQVDYAEMLSLTEAALEAFSQAQLHEDTASNQRTGLTLTLGELRTAFNLFTVRKEGVIRDALGGTKTTVGYLEFFPAGLNEYNRATLEEIEPLMERFVAAAQRYTAQLGAELATDAAALHTSFVSVRTAQLSKKGTVSAEKSAGKTARQVLTQLLTQNLLLLASENIGYPERVTIFFDQTRLTDR
jgi:hypothetical protein